MNTAVCAVRRDIDQALEKLYAGYECVLQEYWSRIPLQQEFSLLNGQGAFSVISRGIWNHGPGPDFLSAKLSVNGEIRFGDVEIHCRASDWIAHGHSHDRAYDNVILHVVGKDDVLPAKRSFLPDIPHFDLCSLWEKGDPANLEESLLKQGLCSGFFSRLPKKEILDFVETAGMERFYGKSDDMLRSMIQSGLPQAFLKRFFDLSGVPSNRKTFQILAERLFSYPEKELKTHFSALLWGESELLPDPTRTNLNPDSAELVHSLWEDWWNLRLSVRTPLVFKRECRPLNSVERRLAVIDFFVSAFGFDPFPELEKMLLEEKDSPERFREQMLLRWNPEKSFWKEHTSFTSAVLEHPAQLVGDSRAAELLIDLIFPALHAYSILQGKPELGKLAEEHVRQIPAASQNRITRLMTDYCFRAQGDIFHSALTQQGLIHLYRNYCGSNSFDCSVCPIYHSI